MPSLNLSHVHLALLSDALATKIIILRDLAKRSAKRRTPDDPSIANARLASIQHLEHLLNLINLARSAPPQPPDNLLPFP